MNIRSNRYKNTISVDDIPVRLTRIEDNKVFEPMYLNAFSKVYYVAEDSNIIFIKDNCLKKYNIQEIKED